MCQNLKLYLKIKPEESINESFYNLGLCEVFLNDIKIRNYKRNNTRFDSIKIS